MDTELAIERRRNRHGQIDDRRHEDEQINLEDQDIGQLMETAAEPQQGNERHEKRQRARIFDRRIILETGPDEADIDPDHVNEDKIG